MKMRPQFLINHQLDFNNRQILDKAPNNKKKLHNQ